jgi:hypothetical protein
MPKICFGKGVCSEHRGIFLTNFCFRDTFLICLFSQPYYPNPVEIPPQDIEVKGLYRPSNIFVQHNAGSKFILLNRPSSLNALDLGMIQDLHNTYKEAEGDESVFLYLLYGAGEKAFCAGGATPAHPPPHPRG